MLVMSGGSKVANEMIADDIVTPLETVLNKTYAELFSGKSLVEDDVKKEILISAIKLLWTLSENSEMAVQFASRPKTMNVLISSAECSDNGLALSAVQCLQTISEDNTSVITQLSKRQDHMLSVLIQESDAPEIIQLQTIFASLLVNIHNGLISRVLPATLIAVVATLTNCLKKNTIAQLESSSSIGKGEEMDQDIGGEMDNDEDDKSEAEAQNSSKGSSNELYVKQIYSIGLLIDAQVCALETLANICTNDDDDEAMELSESSEEAFSETELEEELSSNFQSLSLPPTLPPEVVETILKSEVLALIMEKAKPLPSELISNLGPFVEEEDIPNRLRRVQTRALLCLHNLVRGLPLEGLGGAQQLQNTWKSLALKIVTEWNNDPELLEAASTTLRALSTRLAEEKSGTKLIEEISSTDLVSLCQLAEQSQDTSVRINIFRVLSSISAIASDNYSDKTSPLILTAGRFLLEQSGKETDIVVVAEALDALMDALSEDCTDGACAEMQLVQRLQSMLPSLQHKIRSQRTKMPVGNPVVKTVKSNLTRFIKYKAKRCI
ncbi:HEAT repeat-containing protein 3 isoform X2 [Neocloeon triangulifer]|nr:HEAT repeat-containing protein 3 isoform X2 [Neocloeon triangulifer]